MLWFNYIPGHFNGFLCWTVHLTLSRQRKMRYEVNIKFQYNIYKYGNKKHLSTLVSQH